MWLLLAIISAVSAGVTSILGKVGLKNVDSDVGVFLRTGVVLIFTFIFVLIVGTLPTIVDISWQGWLFIIASGLSTGLSWIFFFKALQIGDVNKVVPIDKLSVVTTMVFAIILFNEAFTAWTMLALITITVGTIMMIEFKKREEEIEKLPRNYLWLILALLAMVFATATTIFARLGMQEIDTHLGTFLRTIVVLFMAFIIIVSRKKLPRIKEFNQKNWIFITLSGIATGVSWLAYFAAIQIGDLSVIVPIDKLSIAVTIIFSYFVFKEKLSRRALIGLFLLITGTMIMVLL